MQSCPAYFAEVLSSTAPSQHDTSDWLVTDELRFDFTDFEATTSDKVVKVSPATTMLIEMTKFYTEVIGGTVQKSSTSNSGVQTVIVNLDQLTPCFTLLADQLLLIANSQLLTLKNTLTRSTTNTSKAPTADLINTLIITGPMMSEPKTSLSQAFSRSLKLADKSTGVSPLPETRIKFMHLTPLAGPSNSI